MTKVSKSLASSSVDQDTYHKRSKVTVPVNKSTFGTIGVFQRRRQTYASAYRHIIEKEYNNASESCDGNYRSPLAEQQAHYYMNCVGEVYEPQVGAPLTCGSNFASQLGMSNDEILQTARFTEVPDHPKNIVSVAAGGLHCLALRDDGTVFCWGDNGQGQCGRLPWNPKRNMNPEFDMIVNAHGIYLDEGFIAVDAGDSHSIALTIEGSVYFFGAYRNEAGTFYRDLADDLDDPRYYEEKKVLKASQVAKYEDPPNGSQFFPIKIALQEKVTKIASGSNFNAAILRSGICVTWGLNTRGALGRKIEGRDGDTFFSPDKVSWYDEDDLAKSNFKRKVRDVACGGYHMLLVAQDCSPDGSSSNWCVYSCGLNMHGQLGLGFNSTRENETAVLTKIPFFDQKNIAFVAAGLHHSLCLDITRQNLYSFGRGDSGQLGITSRQPVFEYFESDPQPVYLHSRRFGARKQDVSMKVNPKIKSIACADNHNMVITEEGDLFTWGFGDTGALGNGELKDSYCPQKAHENVLQASGGAHHSIILHKKL